MTTRSLPMQTRLAQITPRAETQTLELTWSTGAQVRRYDWSRDEIVMEELDLAGADLSRLNAGAPVLNSHSAYDLSSVIGVVDRAWIDGDVGKAEIRLSERPEVAGIRADIASGILRNISIGYAVRAAERIRATTPGTPDTLRVTQFEPMEISIVAVPADAGAQLQRANQPEYPVFIREEPAMTEEVTKGPETPEPQIEQTETTTEQPAVITEEQVRAAAAQAVRAERARIAEITDLCARVRHADMAQQFIRDGAEIDSVRAALLDVWAGEGGAEIRRQPEQSGSDFEARVADAMASGQTRSAAIREIASAHPDLHRDYLARINRAA